MLLQYLQRLDQNQLKGIDRDTATQSWLPPVQSQQMVHDHGFPDCSSLSHCYVA
jgi:hypothetical protein